MIAIPIVFGVGLIYIIKDSFTNDRGEDQVKKL